MNRRFARMLRRVANLFDPQPQPEQGPGWPGVVTYSGTTPLNLTATSASNGVWFCHGCGVWILAGRHTCTGPGRIVINGGHAS